MHDAGPYRTLGATVLSIFRFAEEAFVAEGIVVLSAIEFVMVIAVMPSVRFRS